VSVTVPVTAAVCAKEQCRAKVKLRVKKISFGIVVKVS
jgi:hypothetical protein